MAHPKKGALHQVFVTMVDSTDFASVESGITASDFNSGVTAKFYGMNTGGSAATTSGTISKTASLVHSGVFRITLKTTENNYDLMQVRFNKTGCAEQIIEWQNVDNDDSDIMSALTVIQSMASDAASAATQGNSRVLLVQSQLSDAYSQLSDFRSDIHSFVSTTGVGLHASALSDLRSAIAAVTASVSASDMSDIRSAITAASSDIKSYVSGIGASASDVASAVNVELGSRLSDILSAAQQANSRVLVIQSMTSDVYSQLSDFRSDLNSVITTTGVQLNASMLSDLRSAITASAGSLSASDISDIASAVVAAIGSTGVALDASTMSDIRSAVLLVQSMASDAASAAQQANSRVLVVQSMTSDVASQITAFQSDLLSLVNTTGVGLNASTMSDLRSAVTAAVGDASTLSDILSAAQQAASRVLVVQSMSSDIASQIADILVDTGTDIPAAITAAERDVVQMVESQRGHHTACGAIFFVRKGGNDANPGTYALPFLTIQAALDACTANAHDTVIVLGVTGSDPSTFSEALTMSKPYVFLRGMGRDVKVTTAGAASSTITVSAKGCEVSGLWVNNTGTGATKGIETASGSDFVWLHHLFIDGAATGVGVVAGSNITVENCRINDCATAGVNVAQGAGVGLHVRVLTNHIDGSPTGINFAGSDSNESIARYNNISQCTTGVVVASGATSVQVTDNRFAGNTTDWTDAGTNTNLSWNTLSTTIAGTVSRVTLTDTVTTYTGNTPQTGDGFAYLGTNLGLLGANATEAGGTGDQLTAINLPNQTMDIVGNITGNLSGSVGSVTTNNDKTGYRLSSTGVDDILRTALTEAYAADGAAGTLSEILFGLQAFLQERAVSGTTLTVKKLDGSTTAMTFTLNDATTPTSVTRAS